MVRVLYVDDEAAMLELTKVFLERGGDIEVDSLRNAAEAIEVLAKHNYDVIVSDYQMSGIDGIDLLKTVRKAHPDTPFILFTGKGRESVAIQALNEGASFYLQKSGDITPMFAELRSVIIQCYQTSAAKKSERQAWNRFNSFVLASKDIIYRMRIVPEPGMEYFSPIVEKIVGYTPQEFYEQPDLIFKCIHPDDLEALNKAIENPEAYNGPVTFRWVHKDGHVVWAEDTWVPVRDESGQIVAVDGISRDISDRVRILEELKNANKRLELLGRLIRHDILNQLIHIEAAVELVRMSSGQKQEQQFKRIMEAAHVIQMQLSFSGYELDTLPDRPLWQSISEVVGSIVSSAKTRGVTVETDIRGVEIPGDVVFGRVILNLIEDSLVHGEKVRHIKMRTEIRDGGIDFIYEDDGIGIPHVQKEDIFRKGFGKGTGYGLYLSREVLALGGATIVECGEPGEGAKFVIRFPEGTYRSSLSNVN